jgi:4-hydroxy-3-methylbut-2-enyl diphosphate reductase
VKSAWSWACPATWSRAEWLNDAASVGLTAGASAPEALVMDVIAALRAIEPVELVQMDGEAEGIVFRLPAALRGQAAAAAKA